MAKHLLFDYEFDASAKTITLNDIYAQKVFLLITNVNDGEIIFAFNDAAKGISNIEFDYENVQTTITLEYDTTSMADTDPLQIFIDEQSAVFAPADEYIDPVSKIRVSNPENLIDTDFEYGLQDTKWETLELTNNIPTFFSRSGGVTIPISNAEVTSGSDIVTVTCSADHGLQLGTPLIVVGTTIITCDGGFIVSGIISDRIFTYKAKARLQFTGSIFETNTFIFPAGIYSGTEFKVTAVGAITTDGAANSTLTSSLEYPANFSVGTSFSLSNSFATVVNEFDTADVNLGSAVTTTKTITQSSTAATGPYSKGPLQPIAWQPSSGAIAADVWPQIIFDQGADISIANNRITFGEAHGFNTGDAVLYMAAVDSTPIGGLQRNKGYFVTRINDLTIQLHTGAGTGTPVVSLSTVGTSVGLKSAFIRGCVVTLANNIPATSGGKFGGSSPRDFYYQCFNSSHAGLLSNQQGDAAINFQMVYSGGNNSGPPSTTFYSNNADEHRRARSFGYTFFRQQGVGSSRIERRDSPTGQEVFDLSNDDSRNFLVLPIGDGLPVDHPTVNHIRIDNHGFTDGVAASLTVNAGSNISPLINGRGYYMDRVDANTITLRDANTNANVQLNDSGSSTMSLSFSTTATDPLGDTISIGTDESGILSDGKQFTYLTDGGTAIGGLANDTVYFMTRVNSGRFAVSTTANPVSQSFSLNNSTNVDATNDEIDITSHGMSTGDCINYKSSNVIPGLVNNAIYYIRAVTANSFSLHPSSADATSNTNKIPILGTNTFSSTIDKVNIVDLTSVPSPAETHQIKVGAIGSADGVYSLKTIANDGLSFTMETGSSITARDFGTDSQGSFIADLDGFYAQDHGFVTGDSATVTLSGDTNVSGITSGDTYYLIADSKDFYRLATSEANAIAGTAINLTETGAVSSPQDGTITTSPDSVVGKFAGQGTVTVEDGLDFITGTDTNFSAYLIAGDDVQIHVPDFGDDINFTSVDTSTDIITSLTHGLSTGDPILFEPGTNGTLPSGIVQNDIYFVRVLSSITFTLHYSKTDADANTNIVDITTAGTTPITFKKINGRGKFITKTISYINSANRMIVTEPFDETVGNTSYMLQTRLLLRNDGFALHRPYDGGVELIPSSNPDSQMIRQTRKYFRYQSGKGIQVSFAINFSPTSQIDVFSYDAAEDEGIIKTRFPHRLTAGLVVKTFGATNTPDPIGTVTIPVSVDSGKFNFTGIGSAPYKLLEGRTYVFDQSDASNSGNTIAFSTTEDGTHNGGTEYTTGVTYDGTAGTDGQLQIIVADGAPTLYIYSKENSGYGYEVQTDVDPENGVRVLWNDAFTVTEIVDDYQFKVTFNGTPSDPKGLGLIEYYVDGWRNSEIKCGLFDDQNGLFFKYNGETLFCCRRSSIKQISGYANVTFRSGTIVGTDSAYASQLIVGERIAIKGQVYTVTKIDGDNQFHILPTYRGKSSDRTVITKVETTAIPQSQWNIDKADGTGKNGFKLDINKIQMAYIDYSWYGAGKVRFGFKDQNGNVKYVHYFAHGNYFTEAYMRSGNIPARYELENLGQPTYVPALAHWGTSVIMDGRFDPDRAYIFNASSQVIALTNQDQLTVNGDIETTGLYYFDISRGQSIFANYQPLRHGIKVGNSSTLNSLEENTLITGTGLATNTKLKNPPGGVNTGFDQPYQPNIRVRTDPADVATEEIISLLLLDRAPSATTSNVNYIVGEAGDTVNVTKRIPLISIRLAPSVDNSNIGDLGAREIVNRMQLILNDCAILTTHAVQVELILNGTLSVNNYEAVERPSLSQLQYHSPSDTITGGASVINFRPAGDQGTSRVPQLTEQSLAGIATLGNSIMGGDNVYPDGPDVLTVTATLIEDPSTVSELTPFTITSRVGWSESQA